MRRGGSEPELRRLAAEQFIAPLPLRVYHQTVGNHVGLHWHEFYEMHFIIAGRGRHAVNGIARPVARGSLVLLTPSDIHELDPRPDAPLELYNVIFADDLIPEEVRPLLFDSGEMGDGYDAGINFDASDLAVDALETEFQRLWSEACERPTGYERALRITLERILIDLGRLNAARAPTGAPGGGCIGQQRPDVRAIILYMHQHFREPLTLDRVAAHAHLSSHYASTLFHRATGLSFQIYLSELRLRFARTLLRVSDLPVTEICHASGFATLSHFERAFRRAYGQSPRLYRAEGRHDGHNGW